MKKPSKLRVSVGYNVEDELVNVILVDNGMSFMEGTIKDRQTVVFTFPVDVKERDDGVLEIKSEQSLKTYDFAEVKEALLEFIDLMETLQYD